MRNRPASAAFGVVVCLAISPKIAEADSGIFNETRLGVYQHDTGLIGNQKESGVDFSFEVLSRPLFSLSIGSPRVVVGSVVNTAGQTNQVYAGFADYWNFAQSVFTPGDAFFIEGTVGVDWHDGKIDVVGTPLESDWKSHGSRFLIRSGGDLGYRINPTWSVALSFNHISNADLATRNEGMNDLGLRVGMHF